MIGGYSRSEVKGKPFSSLLLGTFADGKLVYSGKVGTGFDARDFTRLAKTFEPLERRNSPFEEVPRRGAQGRGVARAEARLPDRLHGNDA